MLNGFRFILHMVSQPRNVAKKISVAHLRFHVEFFDPKFNYRLKVVDCLFKSFHVLFFCMILFLC